MAVYNGGCSPGTLVLLELNLTVNGDTGFHSIKAFAADSVSVKSTPACTCFSS